MEDFVVFTSCQPTSMLAGSETFMLAGSGFTARYDTDDNNHSDYMLSTH